MKTYKDTSLKNKDKTGPTTENQKQGKPAGRSSSSYEEDANTFEYNLDSYKLQLSTSVKTKSDRSSAEIPNRPSDSEPNNLFEEDKNDARNVVYDQTYVTRDENDEIVVTIPQPRNQLLLGDILLRIKHKGSFSNSLVCRIWFNTSFTFNEKMKYTIKDVDPVSIRKDERFDPNFALTLITEPFCRKWTSKVPISELCRACTINLEDEIKKWKKIHKIVEYHKSTFKAQLLFKYAAAMHYLHSEKNDYNEVLGKNEAFRKQSFRWSKTDGDWGMLCGNSDSDSDSFSGSEGKDDDQDVNSEEYFNDMGEVIELHNEQMYKSNSTHINEENEHLQEQNEVLLQRKQTDLFKDIVDVPEQKESVAIDSTLDTNSTRRPAEYKPGDYQKLEPPANLEKIEEDKETKNAPDDYFDMIQRQFLDTIPVSRGWVFKKKKSLNVLNRISVELSESEENIPEPVPLVSRKPSSLNNINNRQKADLYFSSNDELGQQE